MKREVEILVEVQSNVQDCLDALKRFEHKGIQHTIDTYYYDSRDAALQPDDEGRLSASFRVRDRAGDYSAAYKVDKFDGDGTWLYSEEHETGLADLSNFQEIVSHLGLLELVRIDNTKHVYETPLYEIVLEEVADLGLFLEVEHKESVEEQQVSLVKQEIWAFIQDQLGIQVSEELNMGKPELMLRKRAGSRIPS